jgi:hypothetical protein
VSLENEYESIISRLPAPIKAISRELTEGAHYPHKEIRLFGALAIAQATINRDVVIRHGNRVWANLYYAFIAPTGWGKDIVAKVARKIIYACNAISNQPIEVVRRFGSPQGLENFILEKWKMIRIADEESAYSDKDKKTMLEMLDEMYSAIDDLYKQRILVAGADGPKQIWNPYYTQITLSTAVRHFDADPSMKLLQQESGQTRRNMQVVIETPKRGKHNKNVRDVKVPKRTKVWRRKLEEKIPLIERDIENPFHSAAQPLEIPMSIEAKQYMEGLSDKLDDEVDLRYKKALEVAFLTGFGHQSLQIALTLSAAKLETEVSLETVKLATEIMHLYRRQMFPALKRRAHISTASNDAHVIAEKIKEMLEDKKETAKLKSMSHRNYYMQAMEEYNLLPCSVVNRLLANKMTDFKKAVEYAGHIALFSVVSAPDGLNVPKNARGQVKLYKLGG